jgi:hypothetical protein
MRDESFLKQFYSDYIRLLQREGAVPYAKILQRIQRSLAPEYLASIQQSLADLDVDPILLAQDYSDAWAEQVSVTVKPASQEPVRYLVCFGAPGQMRHALEVAVTRQGGAQLLNAPRGAQPAACPH